MNKFTYYVKDQKSVTAVLDDLVQISQQILPKVSGEAILIPVQASTSLVKSLLSFSKIARSKFELKQNSLQMILGTKNSVEISLVHV